MNSRVERTKQLVPRDEWLAATFEGARIANLRDAQFVPLSEKLAWLDEAREYAKRTGERSTEKRSACPSNRERTHE